MSGEFPQSAIGIGEPDTLLLYCPYDRKVTRHARRAPGNEFTCLECGRRLDAGESGEAALTPAPSLRQAPAGAPESLRRVRVRPQRLRGVWLPVALMGVVLMVGLLGAIHVASNLLATSSPPSLVGGQVSAETVEIGNTDGVGAYIRRTPNLEDRLQAWPDGTPLKVIGADISADGILWKQIEDPAGNRGWIPAQYTLGTR